MKTIKTPNDLAINGAIPAFDKPLHVGRPNTSNHEYFNKLTQEILERNWLTNNGPLTQQFEEKIANHHKVKHCIAICNGTIALEIAIKALNLSGEVIIPSYTFIATAHALNWQAITPVFADIDPNTHIIDPESVAALITPKTSGIIGVHLWGRTANIEALEEIAKQNNLKLMFDAAHAFGCSYQNKMVGNFGECEVLSFHATKVLHAFEGGAILTNNDKLAEKIRLMRNFGFAGLDNVIHPGTNGKMSEICAAMGLANLQSISSTIAKNKENYELYRECFEAVPYIRALTFDYSEYNNFQYIVAEVESNSPVSRDKIIDVLRAENVLARKYFWPGCHNMEPYKTLYPEAKENLPMTNSIAQRAFVLPTGTSITKNDISTICFLIEKTIDLYS